MASVASQLIEEVTAHAQRDSLEDAREICADGTYFPNNLRTYIHTYIHTYTYTHIHTYIHTYIHIFTMLPYILTLHFRLRCLVTVLLSLTCLEVHFVNSCQPGKKNVDRLTQYVSAAIYATLCLAACEALVEYTYSSSGY
jgi:hypothetical protein